jgi:hypothetical protein
MAQAGGGQVIEDIGRGFQEWFEFMAAVFVVLLVFLPLGVWKAIEIVLWIFSHLHWS